MAAASSWQRCAQSIWSNEQAEEICMNNSIETDGNTIMSDQQ